jgi:hypothetical protein
MGGSAAAPGQARGGTQLAPGEEVLVDGRFMYSTTAFYLETELVLTSRRFIATRPNTLLGLIPVGTGRSNFPIENIAGVNAGTHFHVPGLILGILALLVGLAGLTIPDTRILGVLLLVLAVNAIVSAPKQAIEVMNSGGGKVVFPVSFFERHETLVFASQVSEAIARQGRSTGYATPPAAPAPTQATASDARSALRHLEDLRNDGLITAEEYAAKRAEVLSRL